MTDQPSLFEPSQEEIEEAEDFSFYIALRDNPEEQEG